MLLLLIMMRSSHVRSLSCLAGEIVPGRSFNPEAATEESGALIKLLRETGVAQWTCHVDLHETTDTDETEFRPAKAARDGEKHEPDGIPDGFYLVADMTNPQASYFLSSLPPTLL